MRNQICICSGIQYIFAYLCYLRFSYRYRTLSPSNAKTENQDDGYETSAGDVLTPNSHSSSTHSITPQHQLHHGHGPQQNKHDEQLLSQSSSQSQTVAPSNNNNQGSLPAHLPIKHSIQPHGVVLPSAPYSFMSEEMRVLSPDVPVIANASSYAPLPATVTESITGAGSASGSTSVTPSAPIADIAKRSDIYQDQTMLQNPQQLVNSEAFVGSLDSGSKQSLDGDNSNCAGGATTSIKPSTVAVDGVVISPRPLPKRRGRKKKSLCSDNMETTVSPNG